MEATPSGPAVVSRPSAEMDSTRRKVSSKRRSRGTGEEDVDTDAAPDSEEEVEQGKSGHGRQVRARDSGRAPSKVRRRLSEEEEDEYAAEDDEDEEDDEGDYEDAEGLAEAGAGAGTAGGDDGTEVGIIEQVEVQNFMCHSHMRVDLHPRLNFIVGANGSGKSAICGAVQMCLGIKARDTHRGNSAKALVNRDTRGDCILRVKLRNKGKDAVNPVMYGKSITVERKISRATGASTYKIISEAGKVVGTNKAKDLDPLLESMNIQVDNPIVVLDQENTKKFMYGSAEHKYRFFLRATEFERTADEIAQAQKKVSMMKVELSKAKTNLDPHHMAVKEAEKIVKDMESIKKIDEAIEEAEDLVLWANLAMRQPKVTKAETKFQKASAQMDVFAAKVTKKQAEAAEAQEAYDVLTKQAEEAKGRSAEVKARLTDAKAERNAAETVRRNAKNDLKVASADLQVRTRELKGAQRAVEQREGQLKRSDKALERKKHQDKLQATNEAIDALQTNVSAAQGALQTAEQKTEDAEKMFKTFTLASEEDFRSLQSRLNGLVRSRKDPWGPYPDNMHRLVAAIAAGQGGFEDGPPIGPIARHVKVSPGPIARYSRQIEGYVKHLWTKFIVRSQRDGRRLQALAKKVKCRVHMEYIVMTNEPRIEPPRARLPPGFHLAIDALQVDNDSVYNALVELGKLDNTAIYPSYQEMNEKLFVSGREGRQFPPHVMAAIGPDNRCVKIKYGGVSDTTIEPKSQFLVLDVEAAITDTERRLEALQPRIDEEKAEKARLKKAFTDAQTFTRSCQRDLNKFERALVSQTKKLHDLRAVELPDDDDDDNELLALRETAEEARQAAEEAKARMDEVKAVFEAAADALQPHLDQVAALEEQLKRTDISRVKVELAEAVGALEVAEKAVEKACKNRDKAESMVKEVEHEYKMQLAGYEAELEGVKRTTGQDEVPEDLPSVKDAQAQVNRLRTKKDHATRRFEGVNFDDAMIRYEEARDSFKSMENLYDRTKANHASLDKALDDRRKVFKKAVQSTSDVISKYFSDRLVTRGHQGRVDYDHKEQQLRVEVTVDAFARSQFTQAESGHDDEEEGKATDAGSLSGGERSFTSLCLIAAFGEVIEAPFRVIDEFDVFMDEESRKAALEMLLQQSTDKPRNQFIFLTPHEVTAIGDADPSRFKLHKMLPPRAGAHGARRR